MKRCSPSLDTRKTKSKTLVSYYMHLLKWLQCLNTIGLTILRSNKDGKQLERWWWSTNWYNNSKNNVHLLSKVNPTAEYLPQSKGPQVCSKRPDNTLFLQTKVITGYITKWTIVFRQCLISYTHYLITSPPKEPACLEFTLLGLRCKTLSSLL